MHKRHFLLLPAVISAVILSVALAACGGSSEQGALGQHANGATWRRDGGAECRRCGANGRSTTNRHAYAADPGATAANADAGAATSATSAGAGPAGPKTARGITSAGSAGTASPRATSATRVITVALLRFAPTVIDATAGQTLTINMVNTDFMVPHDIGIGSNRTTTCAGPCSSGFTFTVPRGSTILTCTLHADMTVTVNGR